MSSAFCSRPAPPALCIFALAGTLATGDADAVQDDCVSQSGVTRSDRYTTEIRAWGVQWFDVSTTAVLPNPVAPTSDDIAALKIGAGATARGTGEETTQITVSTDPSVSPICKDYLGLDAEGSTLDIREFCQSVIFSGGLSLRGTPESPVAPGQSVGAWSSAGGVGFSTAANACAGAVAQALPTRSNPNGARTEMHVESAAFEVGGCCGDRTSNGAATAGATANISTQYTVMQQPAVQEDPSATWVFATVITGTLDMNFTIADPLVPGTSSRASGAGGPGNAGVQTILDTDLGTPGFQSLVTCGSSAPTAIQLCTDDINYTENNDTERPDDIIRIASTQLALFGFTAEVSGSAEPVRNTVILATDPATGVVTASATDPGSLTLTPGQNSYGTGDVRRVASWDFSIGSSVGVPVGETVSVDTASFAIDSESHDFDGDGVLGCGDVTAAVRRALAVDVFTNQFDPTAQLAEAGNLRMLLTSEPLASLVAAGAVAATPCVLGDFDGDGALTVCDLHEMRLTFGAASCRGAPIDAEDTQYTGMADLDLDGDIDCDDEAALLALDLGYSGDFDQDGDVDLGDFGVFGAAFGSFEGDANYAPDADFDNDGDVDLGDFGVFGGNFGTEAGNQSTPPAGC